MSRSLDRSRGTPLWTQLHDDLLRRVEGGEFPDRFPGELELVGDYSVSRHTVREALRRLRADGVIESSRGRSSVARPGVITQQLGAMYSLFHELEARGITQTSRVLALDLVADADVATRLGLSVDTELVHLERLRLGDDEPIAWDRAWLAPDVGAPLLDADFRHTGLYDEWQRTAGVRLTGGCETIRALAPTQEQRRLLDVGRGEAVLEIDRVGCLRDRPVEFRRTLVRGSRFSLTAEWSSGRPYQLDVRG